MLKTLSLSTIALLSATAVAQAQQLTGGDVSLTYAAPTDSDIDLDGFNLRGSAEFAVNREIAFQGDLSYTDIQSGDFSADALHFGAHAIYHANDNASFGAYLGRTDAEDIKLTSYGIEGGYEIESTKIAGYFGVTAVDVDSVVDSFFDIDTDTDVNIDINQLGLSVTHDLSNAFAISGRFDNARLSGLVTVRRIGLGAEYQVSQNVSLSAEIGQLNEDVAGESSENESYMNVSATYNFGAKRGATFGQNDLLTSILGF